jgi:uncharacterized repeat protein (TIGR02543 family)
MKFIKKISITFFLILSLFVFSNMAMSQNVTADLPEPHVLNQAELDELNNMPSVQTYNFKLNKAVYEAGDTVKGTFFIKNDRAYNLPDLKYTVSLAGEYDKRTGLPAKVYDSKPFGSVFLAGSEEGKEVNFSYKLPESYAGDNFGIQIKTFTNAGIPLGWNSVLIKINGVSGVLKIDSAYIEVDGQKFSLQEGPTIKEGKKGEVHIFVSNPLKESAFVSGKINIYNRTITGKLLGTYNTEFFEIKSGGKQEFVLDLNKYISEPGVYEGSFVVLDKENIVRAQEIKFRYIIWGNIVTIQKVVSDKEFVNRGEIVNLDISYTGSPFDITNGETPDQKPMNTKIVLSDLKENVVANYEGLIDYNKGASVKIPLTATKNADYVKIGLTVYDESGKVVTSYNSVLSDTTKERVHDSNNWSMIVLLIVIILAVITLAYFRLFKKKVIVVLLFLMIISFLGIYQKVVADIFWMWARNSNDYSITSQMYILNRGNLAFDSEILPGDQFTINGIITTVSCGNDTPLNPDPARNTSTGVYYHTTLDRVATTSINTLGTIAGPGSSGSSTNPTEVYSFTLPRTTSTPNYFSTTTIGEHWVNVRFNIFNYDNVSSTTIRTVERVGRFYFTVAGVVLKANGSTGSTTVNSGESVNLSWTSAGISTSASHTTGCRVASGNGWTENQATTSSGVIINNLLTTTTYGLECYVNASLGTTTSFVTVNVRPRVIFNKNAVGATGTMNPQSITKNTSAVLSTSTYGYANHTFAGWNTSADGTGTNYADRASYSMGISDVTLYAKWTANPAPTFTVTYNGNENDSGTKPDNQTKINNVTLVLATNSGDLEKGGSTFSGWNTAYDGSGTNYAAGESYTTNADLVLFAKWLDDLSVFLTAATTTLLVGESTTLSYSSSNVGSGSCKLNGATVPTSGQGETGPLNKGTWVYTFTCTNSSGVTKTAPDVSISVSENPNLNLTCCATRGSDTCSDSVLVNNIMTWKIELPNSVPNGTEVGVTYTIDGDIRHVTKTVSSGKIDIAKIYTTVGQKEFSATITSGVKTGSCPTDTTTTVVQEGGGVIEF